MPNWSYTSYKVIQVNGGKDQVKKLYDTMIELEKMPDPGLVENGFGFRWLGNLVSRLGGDWNKVYCRGSWIDTPEYDEEKDVLSFSTETAWSELSETRHFLESVFPDLKFYYMTEEDGMCIYQTNDSEGLFFEDRYYLDTEDGDIESEYFKTLPEAAKYISEAIGKEVHTMDEIETALDEYSEDHDDTFIALREYQVVED